MVSIPMVRYEQLLDIETRVDVLVERILHEKYMNTEDILWILGTDTACDLAQKLRKEDERYKKEMKDENIPE